MRNTPYVKHFDSNGKLLNPIDSYLHNYPNRQARRAKPGTHKFIGNGKGIPLTVVGTQKYLRYKQVIKCKNGDYKVIYHYLPVRRFAA